MQVKKSKLENIPKLRDTEDFDFFDATRSFPTLLQNLGGEEVVDRARDLSLLLFDCDEEIEKADLNYHRGFDRPRVESSDSRGTLDYRVESPDQVKKVRGWLRRAGLSKYNSQLELYSNFYMVGHIGEAGVLCPFTCTVGLEQVLQAVGSKKLQEEFLQKIASSETAFPGSQLLTEHDAGSDIGAIETMAEHVGNDVWRLYGRKFFCSAVDDYILVAAKFREGYGTDNVGIFLMPRKLMVDGGYVLNDLTIERAKLKVGTHLLATVELSLDGAFAYNIGPVENGFNNLMDYVINTSRKMNAAGSLALLSRAYMEIMHYAGLREAYGKAVADHPMPHDSLKTIEAALSAQRALYFSMISDLDKNPTDDLKSDQALWQRFMINLCKYRTAASTKTHIAEALRLMGGNGAILDFSPIPRLLYDSIVFEIWEGTHEVLSLQVARDSKRFSVEHTFRDYLDESIVKYAKKIRTRGFTKTAEWLQHHWNETKPYVEKLGDREWHEVFSRNFLDRVGGMLETAALASYSDITSPQAGLVAYYRNNVAMPRLEPQDLSP